MEISPWVTPALLIGLFAWMRLDIRELRRDLNALRADMNKRFDSVNESMNKRFDNVNGELADQRERMAKLEGALEGFLAGLRDRNAA
jgi:predicted phage gp36 major capsid-like protein